jgi:hypothetical protein
LFGVALPTALVSVNGDGPGLGFTIGSFVRGLPMSEVPEVPLPFTKTRPIVIRRIKLPDLPVIVTMAGARDSNEAVFLPDRPKLAADRVKVLVPEVLIGLKEAVTP